jgi:hypothetical protein
MLLRRKWCVLLPPSVALAAVSAVDGGFTSAAAVVLGLLFGFALMAVREYRDSRFRCEQDVVSVLMLPVLGRVSTMASARERRLRGLRRAAADIIGYLLVLSAVATFAWRRLW